MKKKVFSIKYRVLVWVLALLFPTILLLGAITTLQVNKTYQQLQTSEETSLNLVVSQLEQEVQDVEEYLYPDVKAKLSDGEILFPHCR